MVKHNFFIVQNLFPTEFFFFFFFFVCFDLLLVIQSAWQSVVYHSQLPVIYKTNPWLPSPVTSTLVMAMVCPSLYSIETHAGHWKF